MHMRTLSLAVVGLALLTGCSGIRQLEVKDTPTYTLADLQTQGDAAAARLSGQNGPTIVHLRKGEALPVTLQLGLPGVTLLPGDNRLRFDRDVYVWIGADGAYLSPDGARWAQVGDHRAMRKLFGLGKGGSFQLGLGASKDRGAFISASVALAAAATPN